MVTVGLLLGQHLHKGVKSLNVFAMQYTQLLLVSRPASQPVRSSVIKQEHREEQQQHQLQTSTTTATANNGNRRKHRNRSNNIIDTIRGG